MPLTGTDALYRDTYSLEGLIPTAVTATPVGDSARTDTPARE